MTVLIILKIIASIIVVLLILPWLIHYYSTMFAEGFMQGIENFINKMKKDVEKKKK